MTKHVLQHMRVIVGSWQEDALCLGRLDLLPKFFPPPRASKADYREVRALCRVCPVLTECLEHALKYEPYGFWGGLSERQRKRENIRRKAIA